MGGWGWGGERERGDDDLCSDMSLCQRVVHFYPSPSKPVTFCIKIKSANKSATFAWRKASKDKWNDV